MSTLAARLDTELANIIALMDQLLDSSTIEYVPNRARREAARTGVVIFALSDGAWGPTTDVQARLQRELLERWRPWLEQVKLLFSEDTSARQRSIGDAASAVESWIQRDGKHWWVPPTIEEAKAVFRKNCEPLVSILRSLGAVPGRVVVVPDTNVLIRSPDVAKYGAVLEIESYMVMLAPGVLRELDSFKVNHGNPAVREKARGFSNRIKGCRNQGNLTKGVRVQGEIWVQVDGREPDFTKTLSWLKPDVVDDQIIATILERQRRGPTDRVVLLTGDSIMLAKADAANIPTEDTPDPDP